MKKTKISSLFIWWSFFTDWLTHSVTDWASLRVKITLGIMMTWKYFPRYWPFVRGINRSPVNSPHVNNREAGDLRRYHAHYDATVMESEPHLEAWAAANYIVMNHILKCLVNSLAPGIFQFNFGQVIFKLTLVNGGWGISYEIALRWMPLDLTDDKSTLVQVMAWCRQATSHYLSQCWPSSMSPYDVTRPQWVKQWWK